MGRASRAGQVARAIAATLALAAGARAEEAPPGTALVPIAPVKAPGAPRPPETFWVGTSVVFRNIVNLTTGKLPGVGLSYSLNLSWRMTDTLMGCLDLSAATPIAAFNPNPSMGLGPAFLVAPRFVINPELLYSVSFYYPTDPAPPVGSPARQPNHSLGLSVAFGFIRPPVIIAPVLIASYNVTLNQWMMIFALKLGVSLFSFT